MSTPIKIKVVLEGMPHKVFRKILVPKDINMMQLHYIIQLAMGWTFSHLFQFCDNKWKASIRVSYGDDDSFDMIDVEEKPADLVKLKDEFVENRDSKPFWYWYDFGDDWWHKISFIKPGKRDMDIFNEAPKCVEAIGVCPPEDVGGPSGYDRFLEIISNPKHPEYKGYRAWAGIPEGEKFNTDYVNIQLINAYLTGYFFSPDWKLTADKFFENAPTPFLKNLFW